MAEITSAGVSPGTAIISRPTEQTAVIASSLTRDVYKRQVAAACDKIYDKICRYAGNLVKTGEDISKEYGLSLIHIFVLNIIEHPSAFL